MEIELNESTKTSIHAALKFMKQNHSIMNILRRPSTISMISRTMENLLRTEEVIKDMAGYRTLDKIQSNALDTMRDAYHLKYFDGFKEFSKAHSSMEFIRSFNFQSIIPTFEDIGFTASQRYQKNVENLKYSLLSLVNTYDTLQESLKNHAGPIHKLAYEIPVSEMQLTADLLRGDIRARKGRREERSKNDGLVHPELKEFLSTLNPNYLESLETALITERSNNPGKITTIMGHLRKLLENIIRQLAPENVVTEWTNDPDFYYLDNRGSKRPTRRAQLLFITREINPGQPFGEFMQKDIDTIIDYMNLFSKDLHNYRVGNNDELYGIIRRIESFLLQLARIHKGH